MFRIIYIVFIILLVHYSTGFKWISLSAGDAIPLNAITLKNQPDTYVGRARHYDEVLLAEINSTCAVVESCGENIIKRQYEILVSGDPCHWELFTNLQGIPTNIVRGGTASNGEPIFIGKTSRRSHNYDYRHESDRSGRIKSILLSSTGLSYPQNHGEGHSLLLCDDKNLWTDTSSVHIPNNTVSGGLSEDGNEIFVARLKSRCSIIPGQVTPKLGIATAVNAEDEIQAAYCQVLVGNWNEYKWIESADGDIPDYAVVSSKDARGELMYVARMSNTVGYIMQSTAAQLNMTYSILVKNGY